MKSTTGFLAASYSRSIIETAALLGVPMAGIYLFATYGSVTAFAAMAAIGLLVGLALTGLSGLEDRYAQSVADDRASRRHSRSKI